VPIPVFIDSTELFDSPLLASAEWRELLGRGVRYEITLYFPELVIRETERHYTRKLHEDVEATRRSEGGLRSRGFAVVEQPLADQRDRLLEAFRPTVQEKIDKSQSVVLPMPQVPHSEVVERELDKRKPFNANGKGYRDTLIWLSILERLRSRPASWHGHMPVFVSGNTRDFCRDGGGLHDGLLAEIRSIDPDLTMEHYASISELAAALRSMFAAADAVRLTRAHEVGAVNRVHNAIARAVYDEAERLVDLEVTDSDYLDSRLNGLIIENLEPSDVNNITVTAIDVEEASFSYKVHEEFDDGEIVFEATVVANLSLDGFLSKSDYAALGGDHDVAVVQWDWSDSVASVSLERSVRLTYYVIVFNEMVDSIDLIEAEVE
jgi:hypothetical protein